MQRASSWRSTCEKRLRAGGGRRPHFSASSVCFEKNNKSNGVSMPLTLEQFGLASEQAFTSGEEGERREFDCMSVVLCVLTISFLQKQNYHTGL